MTPSLNHLICGKALIVWEDKSQNKKRDNIDTDQITPSSYCTSESLASLDTRWKEGAFRYLIPDFKERVWRDETFLVVGNRFGIGSSREMSPAGLKGIARDAGKDFVIICGDDVGEIFRKNALHFGIPLIQLPLAVEETQEGDEFCLDLQRYELLNLTQNKKYTVNTFSPREKDLLHSDGIFSLGKREYQSVHAREAKIVWPDKKSAKKMTATEQIIAAHLVNKNDPLIPGSSVKVWADLLPVSDGTAPLSIYTYYQITNSKTPPYKSAIINDHFIYSEEKGVNQYAIAKEFATQFGIQKPYFSEPGDGIFHFYLPEKGLIRPGGFYPGADSHCRAYGAYGGLGIGVGSTTAGFGWALGYIHFTVAKQRRVKLIGALQPWVTGKDIVLALLKKWGTKSAQGMSVEFVDVESQIPIYYRNTIANMMAEAESLNAIFPPDKITRQWFHSKGFSTDYEDFEAGENAEFAIDEEFDLSDVHPMVSRPFSPQLSCHAEIISKEKITCNKAFIGSCTNGSYQDLLDAALIIEEALEKGWRKIHEKTSLIIFPGSELVKKQIELPDRRLKSDSIAGIFRKIGGEIRSSWCGPCFGQGRDALKEGERAITTFNRNWHGRMGRGGLGFLASPIVVASSALSGYICSPKELGLVWKSEKYRSY